MNIAHRFDGSPGDGVVVVGEVPECKQSTFK